MTVSLAAFFVRRWQFTLVALALLTLLGVNALVTIPRSEDPHFPIPAFYVRAVAPGASPTEMEQLVAKPIEDALDGLADLKFISSSNSDGVTVLRAEFNWSVDPDRKYDEVVREVNALRGVLPRGLTRLVVQRTQTTEVSAFQVALVSETLPMRRLEKVARRLRDRLNRIPGVRQASYWGAPQTEMQVAVDMARLAALRLPAGAVADALRNAGAEGPVGAAQAEDRRLNVTSGGAFTSPEAVGDVPVAGAGAEVVRVRDVATVGWAQDVPQHLAWFDGRRALFVTATPKEAADVVRLTGDARRALDEFERTLPAGVRLERGFFQADNVQRRLGGLYRDFGIALALVLLTLAPLGLRAGVVVMLSIPLSLLIGLTVLEAFGFGLNQISIAGFVLALGLLVDDAIVVTENVARRLREGEDRAMAAIAGTGQIALAVAGCTACLMLAFLPLLALPEGPGAYIRSLPAAVLCTVGASFVVSMTIVPFLCSRLLPAHAPAHGNRALRAVSHQIQRLYGPLLHRGLDRPWRTLAVLAVLCVAALPMLHAMGSSLFPKAETPQFLVRVQAPEGAGLSETARALHFAERRLAALPDVAWYAGNLGRGNPPIFYNQAQHEADPAFAEVAVGLKRWQPGHSEAVLRDLRRRLAAYPGARLTVVEFENGTAIEAPIMIRLAGDDLGVLRVLASQAEAVLRGTPGARDVVNPLRVSRTDLDLGIDEDAAAALGVPPGAARRAARIALSGEEAARYRDDDGDDYPVTVRAPLSRDAGVGARQDLSRLDDIYVPAARGAVTRLAFLAHPAARSSPARIDRYNRLRTVTVTANVEESALTSAVTRAAVRRLRAAVVLPPGYGLSLGGQAQQQATSFAGLGAAVLIAVLGIVAVLVLEFGRFRSALVAAGVIPLGIFGAVAALWITGQSMSFTAAIGVVALIGIEIKNSILLVDFTEQLRRQGVELRTALERACEARFLPILLTSVTAIAGLLPLALEHSGLYSPLAIAIIGGLAASTLMSRIATPVMYWLIARRESAATSSRAQVSA